MRSHAATILTLTGYEARDRISWPKHPDGEDRSLAARGRSNATTSDDFGPVGGCDRCGFLGISGNSKEFSTKGLDVRRAEPKGEKELSFETADRVLCREEIVPQLRVWNLGVLGVGDHGKESGSSNHSVGILGAG